jgi:hypothetical protein
MRDWVKSSFCEIPANKAVHVAGCRSRSQNSKFSLGSRDTHGDGIFSWFISEGSIGQVDQDGWALDLASLEKKNHVWDVAVWINEIQGADNQWVHVSDPPAAGVTGEDQFQFYIYDNNDINTTIIVSYSDDHMKTYPWKLFPHAPASPSSS